MRQRKCRSCSEDVRACPGAMTPRHLSRFRRLPPKVQKRSVRGGRTIITINHPVGTEATPFNVLCAYRYQKERLDRRRSVSYARSNYRRKRNRRCQCRGHERCCNQHHSWRHTCDGDQDVRRWIDRSRFPRSTTASSDGFVSK